MRGDFLDDFDFISAKTDNDLEDELRDLKKQLRHIEREILRERRVTFEQVLTNKKILGLYKKVELLSDENQKNSIYKKVEALENSNLKNDNFELYKIRDTLRMKIELINMEICERQFG